MWRGESRGGLLLLLLGLLLLHLPEPLPGETGAGRPREPGGPALRGRQRGGRVAEREERRRCGQAGQGIGARAWGRQLEAAGAPATPEAEDKGRLVRPPGPAGSRRGPRGAAPPSGPRRRSILFLLGSPAPAPSCPCSCRSLSRLGRRSGAGGEQSRAPHASAAPGRCVFMNSINGALTAHTKPFLLLGRDGVGEGLAHWNAFLVPEAREKFEFENEMNH